MAGTDLAVIDRAPAPAAPTPAVQLAVVQGEVHVHVDHGWKAWARTNPGPVTVLAVVGAEVLIGGAGIRFGFYVPPWWAPIVMAAGAAADWRVRRERRYVSTWIRS